MTNDEIFKEAFLKLSPYNKDGRLVNMLNHYASEIIVSATNRLKRGHSRSDGSVRKYYEYLKEDREFVRAFTENKHGELA